MTDTAPNIGDVIIEIEKTVRDRVRKYPDRIAKGYISQPVADHKIACMRRAQTQLTFIEANIDWIVAEAQRRANIKREAAELTAHPAVAAVLEAFPDAEIADVRELLDVDAEIMGPGQGAGSGEGCAGRTAVEGPAP